MILQPDALAEVISRLARADVVGLPTETVYGLAANADDATAVRHIYTLKGRPDDHPLIVHVVDATMVHHYATAIPAFAERIMQAFWPGPLTLILPRRSGAAERPAAGQDTVALRCPAHPLMQAVLTQLLPLGIHGLAAPSANRFGRVSPTTAQHVQDEFGPELAVLDGGPCVVGIESTIVDCSRHTPVLLRPGAITVPQLEDVCGIRVLSKAEQATLAAPAPRAAGTLEAHYAPRARVRLMTGAELKQALTLLAQTTPTPGATPRIAVWARNLTAPPGAPVLARAMPQQADACAQALFAQMRCFDDAGVALIWVETPPDGPDWDGVRDRLQRAAASG